MRSLGLIVLFLAAGSAYGESFAARVNQGTELLRKGDVEGALKTYRDMQVESPESPELYYNIGCAQYESAMKDIQSETPDLAFESLKQAEASFDKVATARDPELRMSAAYNRANCAAQLAKQSVAAGKTKEAPALFESAVKAYEDVLKRYPDHPGAKTNLDHMRFLLKKMLQNPPPPQEQQGEMQDEKKDQQKQDESKSDEAKSDQEGGEKNDQQAQSEQDQQKQSQEQKDQQKQEEQAKAQEQEEKPEEQQSAQETPPPGSSAATQEKAEGSPEKKDLDTVEAILQSLEDQDNREQTSLKNIPQEGRVRRDWW